MHDDRHSGATGVLLFLLGGLAGAVLATLYAPRSGRETRELLGDRLREGAERGRDLRERAVRKGREIIDDAAEAVDRGRGSLEKRKDRLAAAVEAGRQAYHENKDEGSV